MTVYLFTDKELLAHLAVVVGISVSAGALVCWLVLGWRSREEEPPTQPRRRRAQATYRRHLTGTRHNTTEFTPGIVPVPGALAEKTTENLRGVYERVIRR